MSVLTNPSQGNNSLAAEAAKSTQASAITGCTTLEAPSNVAPPGASLPKPVRRKPSSYCLSRSVRASLSTSIKSKNSTDKDCSTSSSKTSAKFA